MSAIPPEQLAYMQAHIDDTRVPAIYGYYSAAIAIAVLSTVLRVAAKRYTRNGISLDDYLAGLASLCIIGESIVNFITGVPNGLGRHIIAVKTAHALEMINLGSFIFTQINSWSVYFVKMAILSFYYRVFPNESFRRVTIGTVVFLSLWTVSVWGVTTFGCLPIRKWWADIDGHCINLIPFGIIANVLNILTDFWVFLMPVPLLWKLRVSVGKRILLCGVFSLGLACCVLTIVRVVNIMSVGSVDYTWENIPLSALYVFEPVGGLLCINIPFIGRAVRRRYLESHSEPDSGLSGPYEKQPEPVQQRRGSRWLRGIDSIQLSDMSTTRTSSPPAERTRGLPWIPPTPERASQGEFTTTTTTATTDVESGLSVPRPPVAFLWDESSNSDVTTSISGGRGAHGSSVR